MNLFGWTLSRAAAARPSEQKSVEALGIDTVIKRLEALYATASGIGVTPENCEESPTVKAIVTAITRRFGSMPVHVLRKTIGSNGRAAKEPEPNHPAERLLAKPNGWQTRVNYWMDASSWLVRYGNHYCFKARGQTGPIRNLIPLHPGSVQPKQDDEDVSLVTYEAMMRRGQRRIFRQDEIHHARTTARDGLKGDSWINDVRESIALEIAAERFGAAFFGNGAMPGLVLKFAEGSQGFKTDEERLAFVSDMETKFGKQGRFKVMLPPKGIEVGDPIPVENEKAQFNQLRMLQRTIIAGAAGVPPHLVGDLSKGTYNNVEQQGGEFTTNVILPLASVFEAAMERDLLTPDDRAGGIIIRFNPDAVLRGDFKARQEGLAIQRQNGVINPNEWRERENMNPRADKGGEEYFATGPSGQMPSGSAGVSDPPAEDDEDAD